MKKTKIFLFLIILLILPLTSFAASFTYTPMEQIPGFTTTGDFCGYISAVYKFGIWTVGIAAMLMIIIGGYMYIMSAGNNASMEKAKSVITDAIIGLILALTSYLILYTINPNLLTCKIGGGGGTSSSQSTTNSGGGTKNGGGGNGSCSTVSDGPCSVENLKKTCFSANAEAASMVCMQESSGRESASSSMDKCQPGKEVVSFGLFQINVSANTISNLNCPPAFSNPYTGKQHNCSIVNASLYGQCSSSAKTASPNIQKACSLSGNGSSWGPWLNTAKKCGL